MAKTFQIAQKVVQLFIVASCALGLAVSVAQGAAIEIDRLEFLGVTLLQQSEIEGVLEIGPGDRLERVRIVRSAQNLQRLYKNKGYEEVTIDTKISKKPGPNGVLEDVLEFAVIEGQPTRIRSIRFVPDAIREERFRKLWEGLLPEIQVKFGLRADDILDQDRLSFGRRQVQELLASEEFFGAKINEVRASPSGQPRMVDLEVGLSLGERVTFGFRGNTFFSVPELQEMIRGLRSIGFGKDYITTIKNRILDEYLSYGYANIKIETLTFDQTNRQERHVTFVIDEGVKVEIDRLDFDGNMVFSNEELRRVFFEKASLIVQRKYYVEKDVQKTAERVLEWIKSNGYLFAKLVTVSTSFLPKKGPIPSNSRVRISISLFEGEQTTVRNVQVVGNGAPSILEGGPPGLSEEEVKGFLGNATGKPLNLYSLSEGIEALKAAYKARGFLDVKIENEDSDDVVRYFDDNHTAEITVIIKEGIQYRISRISVEGLSKTREFIVKREIQFEEQEILEEAKVLDTESRLRRLGIFSNVSTRAVDEPEHPGFKSVRIILQEGVPGLVAGGVGFRNDLGGRIFGQTEYTNLWGRNQSIGLNLAVNRRVEDYRFIEYQGQLNYVYPWFLLKELNFRPSLNVSKNQFATFDAFNLSALATWERRLWSKPTITGLFTGSLERIKQFNAAKFPELDNQTLLIGSIIPALRFDMRDQPLSPSKGMFSQLSYEIALPQVSQSEFPNGDRFTVAYTKLQFRSDFFIPVFGTGVWYLSYRTGFIRNLVDVPRDADGKPIDNRVGTVPLIKQFALGGAGSLRGWKEQEINFQTVAIHGTLAFTNYRTQFDVPFAGALRFGPFLDAGNLILDDYSLGSLKYGTGVGFHYPTPVGPVNLDWGFKLTPDGGDPYRFYFSIGII